MGFKDWLENDLLSEQPHVYGSPVTIRLKGNLFPDITCIDPRIELWPNRDMARKYMMSIIARKSPLYFTDDTGQNVVIDNTKKAFYFVPDPNRRMLLLPQAWTNYAVLMNQTQVFDLKQGTVHKT